MGGFGASFSPQQIRGLAISQTYSGAFDLFRL
jgi:hypothetical protein